MAYPVCRLQRPPLHAGDKRACLLAERGTSEALHRPSVIYRPQMLHMLALLAPSKLLGIEMQPASMLWLVHCAQSGEIQFGVVTEAVEHHPHLVYLSERVGPLCTVCSIPRLKFGGRYW